MVTGDHKITATAIAEELGILEDENQMVVSGPERSLVIQIQDHRKRAGFAGVSPEHKVRVDALKAGHVVAMTGDRVNDAPALRERILELPWDHRHGCGKETAEMVWPMITLPLSWRGQ